MTPPTDVEAIRSALEAYHAELLTRTFPAAAPVLAVKKAMDALPALISEAREAGRLREALTNLDAILDFACPPESGEAFEWPEDPSLLAQRFREARQALLPSAPGGETA